jgi:hypothetical protein
MKRKIDLNSSQGLKALKESLSKHIDKEISKRELEEMINSVSLSDFGTIKQLFENVTGDLYAKADGKKIIRNFVKTIRGDKALKQAYTLYEEVQRVPSNTDKSLVWAVMSDKMRDFDVKALNEGEKKLAGIVKKALKMSSMTADKVEAVMNENKSLNEAFEWLLTEGSKRNNITEACRKIQTLMECVGSKVPTNTLSADKKDTKEVLKDLNTLISECDEQWEKTAIADIVKNRLAGNTKEQLFEKYKQKCVATLNEKCESTVVTEDKMRFETMKQQLSKKMFNESTYSDDLLKFSELNEALMSV